MTEVALFFGVASGVIGAIAIWQNQTITMLREELAQERADRRIKEGNATLRRVRIPDDANTL